MINLSNLEIGKKAKILSVNEGAASLRLSEMGCVPGEVVKVEFKAPFGGPIAISIKDYTLGLRITEAQLINVEYVD